MNKYSWHLTIVLDWKFLLKVALVSAGLYAYAHFFYTKGFTGAITQMQEWFYNNTPKQNNQDHHE